MNLKNWPQAIKLKYALDPPSSSIAWLCIPLGYTVILQALTGMPRADLLEGMEASELLVKFSAEIFSYPFWLQDLSHLPLFFGHTWLWLWFFKSSSKLMRSPALHVSWIYACINELCQFFVPQRFPSFGDLLMNWLGVMLGAACYLYLQKKVYPPVFE